MARPIRVDVEGGVYHVISRGIDRMDILMSWLYSCDLNNQVTNITKGVTADEAGSLVSYSYDAVGQLTDESSGENTSSFIYDAMGNRLSSSENCSGGSQNRSYAPNSQNQYTAITTSGLSSQSSSFSCNANGALTSKIGERVRPPNSSSR